MLGLLRCVYTGVRYQNAAIMFKLIEDTSSNDVVSANTDHSHEASLGTRPIITITTCALKFKRACFFVERPMTW